MPGTPDWQKATQIADSPVYSEAGVFVAAGGTIDTGWTKVSSWKSVRILVSWLSGGGTVQLVFADASGSAYELFDKTWQTSSNCRLNVIVPALGQWFRVILTNTATVANNCNMTVSMSSVNVQAPTYVSPVTSMIDGSSITVPASSTHQLFPPALWTGQTWMNAHFYDTAGKLNIAVNRYYADGSELGGAGYWPGYTADIHQMIAVPDDLWGVNITNTDSSASHELSVYLIRA